MYFMLLTLCYWVIFARFFVICLAQLVLTCLTADTGMTADQAVASWSHTFLEIDHELISTVIIFPSAD